MKKSTLLQNLALTTLIMAGCGGGEQTTSAPTPVEVTAVPPPTPYPTYTLYPIVTAKQSVLF